MHVHKWYLFRFSNFGYDPFLTNLIENTYSCLLIDAKHAPWPSQSFGETKESNQKTAITWVTLNNWTSIKYIANNQKIQLAHNLIFY